METIKLTNPNEVAMLFSHGFIFVEVVEESNIVFAFEKTPELENALTFHRKQVERLREMIRNKANYIKRKKKREENPLADLAYEFKQSTRKIKGAPTKGPDGVWR